MKLQLLSILHERRGVQVNWSDIEASETAGLVAARCAVRGRGRGKEMGTSDQFPGSSHAVALEGCRRSVRDSVRTGQGHSAKLPMPWIGVPGRWFAFMKLLSARYGGCPRQNDRGCRPLCFRGMTLPNSPAAHRQWMATAIARRYLSAWTTRFTSTPRRSQSVHFPVAPGLPILGAGQRVERRTCAPSRRSLSARARVGNRLGFNRVISCRPAAVEAPTIRVHQQLQRRIITGFEMRSGSQDAIASK